MGYKLKRILIYPDGVTEKQVYPGTITETYTFTSSSLPELKTVAKSGYKIQKAVIELSATTNSTWQNLALNSNSTGTFDWLFCQIDTGSSGGGYIRFISQGNTDVKRINFTGPSSTGAFQITFTETECIIKSGTTYGTWTYNSTYTYEAAVKSLVEGIFSSATATGRLNSNGTNPIKRMIITYIPN